MVNKLDITVIIQGPVNQISINAIDNYKRYGEVVVSCWEEDATSQIPSGVCRVIKPLPDRELATGVLKDSTFYWAVSSIYNALQHVETKYIVKTRSDEYYEDLSPFIEQLAENDDMFVCGNIFVRSWDDVPYHIGDHLFVVKTEVLKRAITVLKDMYDKKQPMKAWAEQGPNSAEEILAYSILYAHNVDEEVWNQKSTFSDNFYVIDINRTKNFIVQWVHGRVMWKNQFYNFHKVRDNRDV